MGITILLVAFLGIVSAHSSIIDSEYDSQFERWCSLHGKRYSGNTEKQTRYEVFRSNLRLIQEHNKRRNSSYWLGVNGFSDMTNHEFQSRFFGLNVTFGSRINRVLEPEINLQIPDSVDWRKQGAVAEVKDQRSCGGCWAFSTTGSIEGINQIKTGELVSLSEQELIDCDRKIDNGCEGGLMQNAFTFVIENGGLDTEQDYPYRASQGNCNKMKKNSRVVSIDDYAEVPPNNEQALLKAVSKQPVSVAIEGASFHFQHYAGGVFTGACGENVNHGVLIVGYGTDPNGLNYWIVKNSWGPKWGESGYIRMQRNTGNSKGLCSINTLPSYPIKTSPNPEPAPGPPPPGPRCNIFVQCPSGSTCCCTFKLGPFCLKWGCCGMDSAVCCDDGVHCCPAAYPVCRPASGQCFKGLSSSSSWKNETRVEMLKHEAPSFLYTMMPLW